MTLKNQSAYHSISGRPFGFHFWQFWHLRRLRIIQFLMELHSQLKAAVAELCRGFPDAYWRGLDAQRAYPAEFVEALTKAGYMATLIPEEFGGAGLGVTEAAIILEEIHRSGGNAAACHAQMYIMGTLLRHGSETQKKTYLPAFARGELRLQAFGLTEPTH